MSKIVKSTKKSSSDFSSTNILVIVESPAKCQKIESYLGPGYRCIASFGHFRQLDGLKSIDIKNNFHPSFIPIDTKQTQITKIRKEIQSSRQVILATDDDREGEAIAWHICDTFGLQVETTQRIIFHEITKPAIQAAVQNPGIINMNLVNAQLSRQILDLLVGYNISPQLWTHISSNHKNALSAGRCQSPALRLVYDNQLEINSSPGEKVYNIVGYFTKLNIQYTLNHQYKDKTNIEDFMEDSVSHNHIFECNEPKKVTKSPPLPFTTSSLQQSASNEFHYSPKDTMTICQKLYEDGYITYMRTDCRIYSVEFIDKAKKYITDSWGEKYIKKDIHKMSGGDSQASSTKDGGTEKKKKKEESKSGVKAQEVHEAIRPTDINRKTLPDTMHPREIKMYDLIWKNTLESCMCEAICSSLTSKISAPNNYEYRYTCELIEFPGWKIVDGYDKENPQYQYLRNIKNKSVIPYNKIQAKLTMSNLKSHFSEAGLVKMLEEKGIGRPSTFSSLIDKIQERGYVKKEDVKGVKIECIDYELIGEELQEIITEREFGNEKNKLVIQPIGILVIEFLIKYFDELFKYEFTKNMEDKLDIIAKGDYEWFKLCNECLNHINKLTDLLKESGVKKESIKIDDCHTFTIGRNGPVIKCDLGIDENGKKITELKAVKSNVDMNKLKNGEYNLNDIIDEKATRMLNLNSGGIILGEYNNEELILKNGKFGYYVVWGENKKSLSIPKNKDPGSIKYNDVVKLLDADANSEGSTSSGLIRRLNENISIRKGKFGDYIFHKTSSMKKPSFLKLKGFSEDYNTCDIQSLLSWIQETYNIE